MPYHIVEPVIDYSVRDLCVTRYPNHPKGCPNYNKKRGCPPRAKRFEKLIDTEKAIYVIWNVFHLADHVARMKELHPLWSWRQLTCCLYWQQTARKQLETEIGKFLCTPTTEYEGMRVIRNPEATGVNVTATMMKVGEFLQWPPKTMTYQVAIAGIAL